MTDVPVMFLLEFSRKIREASFNKTINYSLHLKVYSLILASSIYMYVINKYPRKKLNSKILAYSDFELASCAQ